MPRREVEEVSLHSQVTEEPVKSAAGEFSEGRHSEWAYDKEHGSVHVGKRRPSEIASSRTLDLSKQSSRA